MSATPPAPTSGPAGGDLVVELTGVRGLLLDVDDTIVDTRAAMVAAGSVALGVLWPERPEQHRAMAQHYYDDPQRWFRRYASGEVAFDAMRTGRIEEVAAAFGAAVPEAALQRYAVAYDPAFRAAQRLFDDVPELLMAARRAGLPVGLLTNSALAPTTLKLEALDLVDAFDAVVTTDTLGFGKPDPRVYREACRLLGVAPEHVVCIGDSLEWDVLGARSAGLRAVWLDRPAPAGGAAGGAADVARDADAAAAGVVSVHDLDAVTDVLTRVDLGL
ncbi:putative hydrolase of the HAD superfamily [Terracoccus luteus]|uniref:Putative hydrolase of the HAD superfamily n=1 Tax=Terracoccus luteus TaxID=53356 RepID=A0A495XWB4_9MICO|nr:HAD family hydrolase [Terracoccus luteus]RKT77435.1 putative hydrolase of the HAD superfamily [Terracoccus luteus]